ncbi:MAG: hypothetical protein LUC83_10045 [Clostridiales bacterium]|nr:hypothetical protein [Clostridiales bacterium]
MKKQNKKVNCPPCPANQMPDSVKDMMWYFLMKGGQEADIDELEDAVNDLCSMMMQKTAGQKKYKKSSDIDFKNADWIMWRIVIEATALVLSGDLEYLKEGKEHWSND